MLLEGKREERQGREDEEENISSYLMALTETEDNGS